MDYDDSAARPAPGIADGDPLPPDDWSGFSRAARLDAIYAALAGCDLFIAVGTSGQVHPAAGFVEEVRRHGRAHTMELNLEPSAVNSRFAEHRRGPASETVPRLVQELLGSVAG